MSGDRIDIYTYKAKQRGIKTLPPVINNHRWLEGVSVLEHALASKDVDRVREWLTQFNDENLPRCQVVLNKLDSLQKEFDALSEIEEPSELYRDYYTACIKDQFLAMQFEDLLFGVRSANGSIKLLWAEMAPTFRALEFLKQMDPHAIIRFPIHEAMKEIITRKHDLFTALAFDEND